MIVKKKRKGYLHTKFIQFLIESEKVKTNEFDEVEDDEVDADKVKTNEVEDDEVEDDEVEDDEVDADEVIERLVQRIKNSAKEYDAIIQRQKAR